MHAPDNTLLLPPLARQTDSRILFVILDGLGGVLGSEPTALQRATLPHLDALAAESALGRALQIADGITPGSGPGHFSVFGYDPLAVNVGRGLLEAMGVGVDVAPGDVALRGNLCTVDAEGRLTDRRAGRIATEKAAPLVQMLNEGIGKIEDVEVEVHAGLQYRFAAVFRGPGLEPSVADTDPQVTGVPPLAAKPLEPAAAKMARIADLFAARAAEILKGRVVANAVLLRGFSGRPPIPTYAEMARLRACAIAAYPAYRGVARLLGMDVRTEVTPTSSIADEVDVLEKVWNEDYDFFFLHVKATDSAGEDGDEDRKARVIEAFDAELPRIRALGPDVIVVTGDHSTPGPMVGHSWHPVPVLLWGPWAEPDAGAAFDEEACHAGRLGSRLPSTALLRLALANAGKLAKYGA
jgi:2,3-bisphosphoglycerate-independent phosphoglycerate mutase